MSPRQACTWTMLGPERWGPTPALTYCNQVVRLPEISLSFIFSEQMGSQPTLALKEHLTRCSKCVVSFTPNERLIHRLGFRGWGVSTEHRSQHSPAVTCPGSGPACVVWVLTATYSLWGPGRVTQPPCASMPHLSHGGNFNPSLSVVGEGWPRTHILIGS